MTRYSVGLRRLFLTVRDRLHFVWKRLCGVISGYPVYRAPVGHSVFAHDNRALSSTTRSRARVIHQFSCREPIYLPALIEFEHALALLGHVDNKSSYPDFLSTLEQKVATFFEWYQPGRHRLIAPSQGALTSAHFLASKFGFNFSENALEVVRWAVPPIRREFDYHSRPLRVFHYGGFSPYSKGTHDVISVARMLPHVHFEICVDLSHPVTSKLSLQNVSLHPVQDKNRYDAALDRSQIVLNPVYGDGWGIILDAQARALPIVIYDSYDKDEAVHAGVNGFLVPLPKSLSFYDSFYSGVHRDWDEFNFNCASNQAPERTEMLAGAVLEYDKSPELLRNHSLGAHKQLLKLHAPQERIERIRAIYQEILGQEKRR